MSRVDNKSGSHHPAPRSRNANTGGDHGPGVFHQVRAPAPGQLAQQSGGRVAPTHCVEIRVSIRASDGGDPARLTTYPFGTNCNTCDEATDVSPDGSRFVFLRFRRENAANFREEQVALFLENTDGTGLQRITPYGLAAPHEVAAARWSPDGKEILITDGPSNRV